MYFSILAYRLWNVTLFILMVNHLFYYYFTFIIIVIAISIIIIFIIIIIIMIFLSGAILVLCLCPLLIQGQLPTKRICLHQANVLPQSRPVRRVPAGEVKQDVGTVFHSCKSGRKLLWCTHTPELLLCQLSRLNYWHLQTLN